MPTSGGVTVADYSVLLSPKAVRDLDEIWRYVTETFQERSTADALLDSIESAVLSLESLPYRCPERKVGAYANRGFRQMLVGNYIIIYRIDEEAKRVTVSTVVYSGRNI